MKKNVLKYIFVLAASCAYAAPIPSYRVATNIAEKVALDVVSNTVTKTYVESLGIGVEPGDYAVVSNAAVSAAITNALQDVAITTLGSYVDSATNDVLVAAQGYTDEKISEIETPDFSTNNVELVETIETMAPMPGDYAAVSNAAVHAAITNAMQDAALAGKQDALSQEQLANIAAVSNKANDADVVHRNGNETMEGNLTINNASPILLLTNGANDLGLRITNGEKYIATEDYDYQLPHGDGTLVLSDGRGRNGYFASFDSFGKLTDSGVSTNLYLKKTGDTMTGPLDMANYTIHQYSSFGVEYWLYPGMMYMTKAGGAYALDFPLKNGVIATVGDIDLSTNGLWVATTNAIENAVNDIHLFAQYYPEGNVKSAAEFTSGIKYDAPDTTNRTITVKTFCHTNTATNDNSSLVGRVVIPPFVDAQGNPYVSDDGTRFSVVGVSGGSPNNDNTNLTAIVAPNTVMTIGSYAFSYCTSLSSASLPAATAVENSAFRDCTSLYSVYLPAAMSIGNFAFRKCSSLTTITFLHSATNIGSSAFRSCTALKSVSLPSVTTIESSAFESCSTLSTVYIPAATSIKSDAFNSCSALTSIDFGDTPLQSVPYLAPGAFVFVTATTCKIIVPDAQYDEWIAADWWSELVMDGFQFLRHSEWEYARKYEVAKKADKADVEPLLFAQYYPDGSVTNMGQLTPMWDGNSGLKYTYDDANHTATVKPFCSTGNANNDNSALSGRVVIAPYVVTNDIRYVVTGIEAGVDSPGNNSSLTSIVAPTTICDVGTDSFRKCITLASVSFPGATNIGSSAFRTCSALEKVSVPKAQIVRDYAFRSCSVLKEIYLPVCISIDQYAFNQCSALTAVDFSSEVRASMPTLSNVNVFNGVPTTCKIIVPYTQYDAWIAAEGWRDLPQEFIRHAEKADKPATFTTGNIAKFDAQGNPIDSGKKPSDFLLYTPIYKNKTVDLSDPAKLAEVVSNVVELVFGGTAVSGSGGQ